MSFPKPQCHMTLNNAHILLSAVTYFCHTPREGCPDAVEIGLIGGGPIRANGGYESVHAVMTRYWEGAS